ncbi:MAG: 2Fe-2S iron-sulfur cluster binding domain-containing protein [Gammaproteobacteria bacterium]|nr:2Fe-2S iron-sulfur cluster binding domain-containing protein [Gammaproteobacteria bacterium]
MPLIQYISANKKITEIEVPVGLTVMHGAVVNMVDGILAECGGALTCATCHCYIDDNWTEKTGLATAHEKQKLKFVNQPKANSRLSCQITVDESLDGLKVYLPESQVWNR